MKNVRDLKAFGPPIILAAGAVGLLYIALQGVGERSVVYQWLMREWLMRSTLGTALFGWGSVAVAILAAFGLIALVLRPWEHGNRG